MKSLLFAGGLLLAVIPARAIVGEEPILAAPGDKDAQVLVEGGKAVPIATAGNDWPGVQRAAGDLQADIERVTGVKPLAIADTKQLAAAAGRGAILVGTIGHSELIDGLVASGKLNVDAVRGQWEAFVIEVVEKPLPGVDRALVIAGSDKRGTIYGIYDVSQQIGVSPWYWWADVPVTHRDALFIKPGRHVHGSPSVKYRGIFLNDEAPDLTNWVRAKFGEVTTAANPNVIPGVANYGREFYTKIFEVMLRLRANYLWPAMWNNAFNEDDPENARLADEYGIVMGTSHQEPMLRAQKEWDWRYAKTIGSWNYAKNPDVLEKFWREGVRRNKNYESIVTMGLRGANDTEMAPGGPDANRALLEKIVDVQRQILREEVNPDITKVPQMWCLYKEVQEFYEHGMRVPDDVTLLWAEDNWGNIRRLPTAAERNRPGGAGIYYHFDYHGGPRSYQWLNTSPIPKIWEQMSLAKKYGADRIWIVNVGHFKGYEFPLEFFMDLAWDTDRWNGENLGDFGKKWAAREFGPAGGGDVPGLMALYSKYNARRKPEMLAPDTYSATDYREGLLVACDYNALRNACDDIVSAWPFPATARAAFYQLVEFPVRAGAVVNELYRSAANNALYAKEGRASANYWASAVQARFQDYLKMVAQYDALAGGKWTHFMDQPVLGYTTWRDPPENSLNHLKLVEVAVPDAALLGAAVEGSEAAWSGAAGQPRLPRFDAFNRQEFFIDVFRRGKQAFDCGMTADVPWIELRDGTRGLRTALANGSTVRIDDDYRLLVSIDWGKIPTGTAKGSVKISGAGQEVTVAVEASNPTEVTRDTLKGFVEGNGYVSIEPEHYTKRVDAGANHWMRIADYGRTLSGMRAEAPVDAPSATPGKDSPCLEYQMYLFATGPVEVTAITAPTMNFVPDRGVRYAVSFDDEAPQVVTLVPQGFQAQNRNPDWEKVVGNNADYASSKHNIAKPGYHTLKIWMIDPAVVMQKLVVDLGGVKPSYLGPPESFHSK